MSIAIIIGISVFGTLTCTFFFISQAFGSYSRNVSQRLSQLSIERGIGTQVSTLSKNVGDPEGVDRGTLRDFFLRLLPESEKEKENSQNRIINAGIYSPTAMSVYFATKLSLMTTPPVIGLILGWLEVVQMQHGLLLGYLGGAFGMVLPRLWLDKRITSRHRTFTKALPDFLDLVIVCLQGGMSLQSALQRVTEELKVAHPTLAGEMHIVQRDIELGASVDKALKRFAKRSNFDGIKMLATFVRESQRFGTELVEAFRLHADMLRNQRQMAAEERAQKASVKIILPTMLLIFPSVFIVLAGPAVIQIQQAFGK